MDVNAIKKINGLSVIYLTYQITMWCQTNRLSRLKLIS